ncbi:glycine cleavage system protein H [candidate division WOR-1 bacterium RIFOXYB2_FULL_48_7]|uniref:Glycine cleavage system H protein n=1 Tax=candidate division WOR-1 bacterium RIFOXYB2_FULL_48_7 TaxID=1802583 RepID=A0A1F4TUQ3_UNCSA|nr:MAG: glycine cleavage system protein H [candidate division WOR-1 bacterium RIFOXYB2_FULL_48_7]
MYPENLKYSQEHEWVRVEGNKAIIGITHHAQDALGDVVYVELPPVGKEFKAMQEFGVVESVKSVSSLYSPVSGKVTANNASLNDHPEKVNLSPYDEGWIMEMEISNPADLDNLLSAAAYQATLKK